MKTLALLSAIGIVACGQTNQNTVRSSAEGPSANNASGKGEQNELGVSAVSSKFQTTFQTSSQGKSKRAPALKAELAFGNLVSFQAPTSKSSCSGAFAYELDPADPQSALVYFYTATHCFENVNPLGATTLGLSRSSIAFGSANNRPMGFIAPYGLGNSVEVNVIAGEAEVFREGTVRSDLVRVLQSKLPLVQAQQKYLPSCAARSDLGRFKDLAIGAMAADDTGVVQANSRRDVKLKGLGVSVAGSLGIADSGLGTVLLIEDVATIPGNSGGPVWLMDGKPEADEIKEYLCLQGVISRELIVPRYKSGRYELDIDSLFSPVQRPSDLVRWVKVL